MTATGAPASRPIRVVHVAHTIAGGIASFFEEIAAYQTAAYGRDNVHFVIPAGSEAHVPSIDSSQIVTFAGTARDPLSLLSFARSASAAIRRLDPDIVHLHSSFAGAVLRPLLRRRAGSPRIVYCPHGWAFGMDSSAARKRTYAAIERGLARLTDVIIVNSRSEQSLAAQFGLPAGKLRTVHNGISWQSLPSHDDRSARIRLAFIGRHDRQKGLDVLLDAIARLKKDQLEVDVVGSSVVDRPHSRLPDGGANITFHGWLDRAAIAGLLTRVDAVVMPSRWEAFGLVAIEAMRSGVPVIASNKGALPEIVGHGVGGYVFDLDDPDALARLLSGLDRAALARLGVSARARWESEFSADRMNSLTAQAYRDALSLGLVGRRRRQPRARSSALIDGVSGAS